MRVYSNNIALLNNKRGCYSLDPVMGCSYGVAHDPKGCYNDCYAVYNARKYGYDFAKPQLRFFRDEKHKQSILNKINTIDMPFIRIGTSGDPSYNWAHTLDIIKAIDGCNKEIVIVTKQNP